jgi:hypothetical protein
MSDDVAIDGFMNSVQTEFDRWHDPAHRRSGGVEPKAAFEQGVAS